MEDFEIYDQKPSKSLADIQALKFQNPSYPSSSQFDPNNISGDNFYYDDQQEQIDGNLYQNFEHNQPEYVDKQIDKNEIQNSQFQSNYNGEVEQLDVDNQVSQNLDNISLYQNLNVDNQQISNSSSQVSLKQQQQISDNHENRQTNSFIEIKVPKDEGEIVLEKLEGDKQNSDQPIQINPFQNNQVILPEMKSKLCIFINRSSFVDIDKALRIIKSFRKWSQLSETDKRFEGQKKIGLAILDCSLSMYNNQEQLQNQSEIQKPIFDARLNFTNTHIKGSQYFDLEYLTDQKRRISLLQQDKQTQIKQNLLNDQIKNSQKAEGEELMNREQFQASESSNVNELQDLNSLGSLEQFKFLPIPTIDLFIQTMKQMNIKTYDDVILYSQNPTNIEGFASDHERHSHLIGIFRAQYLFELFGHRGNIYILQDYNFKLWQQKGGKVFGYEKAEELSQFYYQIFQQQQQDFQYNTCKQIIKNYQDIKDYQSYQDFKNQNKNQVKNNQYYFKMNSAPLVIDTRPWGTRQFYGEIPKVINFTNFLDLFDTDPQSGAKIIKNPMRLRMLFEEHEGMNFSALDDNLENSGKVQMTWSSLAKKQVVPKKEVTFTCQNGLSSCQAFIALQYAINGYQRQIDIGSMKNQPLSKNFVISVYDGSQSDFKIQEQNKQKKIKEKIQEEKSNDNCLIF